MGALHHFGRPGASRANGVSLHMKPSQKAETDQAVEDEKDRNDEVKKPRHDQDQKAGDDGYNRRDMSDGEGHLRASPLTFIASNRGVPPYHPLPCLVPRQETLCTATGSPPRSKND